MAFSVTRRFHRRRHANRRRGVFTLPEQRHTLPLILLAALAALVTHIAALRATPWVIRFWENSGETSKEQRVQDEEVRVVVRKAPAEELQTSHPVPPAEPTEPEQLEPEPLEIDLLDIDVKELVMAPGETNLPLPAPEEADSSPQETPQLTPAASAMALPSTQDLPDIVEKIPEPTPVNANSVIANASPQSQMLDDAEGLIDQELRRQAKNGTSGLPADTRTLSQLMGLSNLGASSGVARLGTDLLFAFNESKLKNSARISLLQLAALIHKNPSTTFIIEGHTDGIGSPEYNADLSRRRAAAVVEWLARNGVPTSRVLLRACGSSRPLVDTSLPRDKQALNRRVEIHMRKPGEAPPQDCIPAQPVAR